MGCVNLSASPSADIPKDKANICVRARTSARACMCLSVYVFEELRAYTHTNTNTNTHTRVSLCVYTHTHTHTLTHTTYARKGGEHGYLVGGARHQGKIFRLPSSRFKP